MSRILVAEDEMLQREMIRTMLERAGHEVVAVTGGHQCLAQVTSDPFDLLITDMFMPHGDGMSLLVALRDRGIAVPVIGVTGGADGLTHPYVNVMLSLGVDDVLVKPFTAPELNAAVARALRSGPRETGQAETVEWLKRGG